MKEKDAAIIKVLSDIGYVDEPELTPKQEEQLARALDPEKQFLYDVEHVFNPQIQEEGDILGDILNDFPDVGDNKKIQPATKSTPTNKPNRVLFKGQPRDKLPFSSYIRSYDDLRDTLKEKFGNSNITVENIANLFALYNIMIDERLIIELNIDDLKQYREWERELVDDWTGKMTGEEYAALKADIQKNGIKQRGVLDLSREGNGDALAYLGEGNHRMKVAISLGLKKFPVALYYHK